MLASVLFACAAACPPALATTGGYGTLIATGGGAASNAVAAFRVTSPPRAFSLLVTDSAGTTLNLSWSISCSNPARGERGGAVGKATAGHGRWVKRLRTNWIARPTSCSGVVRVSADRSQVRISIYAS